MDRVSRWTAKSCSGTPKAVQFIIKRTFMPKHFIWGEWRSDQELQEIAREMNQSRFIEKELYKETLSKLLREARENHSPKIG